jgi:hypothetical protein
MNDAPADSSATVPDAASSRSRPDQRSNRVLRELIDEMMTSIRGAARRDLWTPEERAQYEDELSMIMMRVRKEAVHLTDRGPQGES